jgi:hypothetical protein
MVMPSPFAQPSDVAVQPLVFSATPGPSSVANPFSPVVAQPTSFSWFGNTNSLDGFGSIWGPPLQPPPEKGSKCIINLPVFGCLLNQRQGESLLGGLLIVAGAVVALAGISIIVRGFLTTAAISTLIPAPVAGAMGSRSRRPRRVIETPDQAPIASSEAPIASS